MKNIFLLCLLILPAVILTVDNGNRFMAYAEEDDVDDEMVDVEGEGEETQVTDDGVEEDDSKIGASQDAETTILFTKPIPPAAGGSFELPGGHLVEFLVGFTNKGGQDFVLETIDASFRYPMDFTFYIQNFTAIAYNRVVKPSHEATLGYSFVPSEQYAGRPFGLNINLNYRDAGGNVFQEAVYNETIQIIELEEGLDGETFFLYVFLAACVVLMLVVGQQFLYSVGKKRVGKKPVVETGTSNPNDVDYDWLPRETLSQLNKMPRSPKQSPNPKQAKQTPKAAKQAAKSPAKPAKSPAKPAKSPAKPVAKKEETQSPRLRKAKRTVGRDD